MPEVRGLRITVRADALRFEVRAKPRAKRSRVVGVVGDALGVHLASPPVDGAANEELLRTLAAALDVPCRWIQILHGEGARTKVLEVVGLSEDELRQRLSEA